LWAFLFPGGSFFSFGFLVFANKQWLPILISTRNTRSDLNEYDFTESRWSVVPAAGRRPRARYRATCVVFRNSMISYGGHDGTRHLSDAHIFDFDTRTWSTLVTEGTPPIPRDSHVSVVHGNSMYCFGKFSMNRLPFVLKGFLAFLMTIVLPVLSYRSELQEGQVVAP